MARRKIVFIIVEGPSDAEALEVIFNRFYDKNEVYCHVMHGDITSEDGNSSTNIKAKIGNIIRQYAKDNHFRQADFKSIIHILDMDGAFIPNDHILHDQNARKPVYAEAFISTYDKRSIERRNRQKSDIINCLSLCQDIWKTPYRAFYMSCNLDHVLHNKRNSDDQTKRTDAFRFVRKYKEDIPGFIQYISCSGFSVMTGFVESWEFIKQNLHSLERHTNLGLCFQDVTAKK